MTRTAEDNAVEFGVLSKQGKDLRLALLAACSVERVGQGKGATAPLKTTATAFARTAGSDKNRVLRHLDAWDKFAKMAKLPLAAKLIPDSAVDLVITDEQAAIWEDKNFVLSEGNRGTRVTASSVAAAVKNDPKVAAAATQALVDKGDINSLSKATAAVAKNRQVERNRARVTSGGSKQKSVQDPKPTISNDPGVNAFLSVQGLAEALRALVTTFPQEWAALSDEARADEDFVGVCEETLDKIDIASAACRGLISGGVSDDELASILEGGV